MSAELAKPDSMGDLDQVDDDPEEEKEGEDSMEEEAKEIEEQCGEEDKEAEERMSLLTEEQKEKSSPSIQLVAGPVSSAPGAAIKVDIEQGPSPRS